mmetsp:Transcript_71378/g.198145  ORF Transcript_71378/g.198145 Transcript_71378/m.198145 type:complete len:130 (+) Transcript_71378:478-867(+)
MSLAPAKQEQLPIGFIFLKVKETPNLVNVVVLKQRSLFLSKVLERNLENVILPEKHRKDVKEVRRKDNFKYQLVPLLIIKQNVAEVVMKSLRILRMLLMVPQHHSLKILNRWLPRSVTIQRCIKNGVKL